MPPSSLPTLTWAQAWDWLSGPPKSIAITLVLAVVCRFLLHRLIKRLVAAATSKHLGRLREIPGAGKALADAITGGERHVQRTKTMGALLQSVVTFVIGTITVLTIMAIIGIPLGPLLASAGVGGVALGFGAQSLVKDFLSGIFMIIEDQYGVGDVIDTGEAIGTVENVSLRVTQLRDANGVTWYVRNGEIIRVGNRSQGWSMATVDIPIAGDESVEKALKIIRTVAKDLADDKEWAPKFLEPPTVVGVESIGPGVVTIRTIAKCVAGENFAIQRELRERIKVSFDAAGIRGPSGSIFPPSGGRS